ncbi:glucose dehydrogenase [acceptor] [Plakobranchus ocellatus]|uniref:Glucose dehydrogenase [acceptor] n=1 Tax=Plakobranchus ocellatus TaxID=259542 RepID=A0AAV3Y6S0_9GAST|nr:glucose dehydrogenase [acceptor] [Plakobranchus ocellatus]
MAAYPIDSTLLVVILVYLMVGLPPLHAKTLNESTCEEPDGQVECGQLHFNSNVSGGGNYTLNCKLSDAANDPLKTPLTSRLRSSYDYIIVGGGSAGSVLASRLSEDPGLQVLLIEAGADDRNKPQLVIPLAGLSTFNSPLDWAYHTMADRRFKGLDNKINIWRSGKVLGGGSSINAMIYCRGSPYDFDRWANYTEDETWDYRHVLSYFMRAEGAQGDLRYSAYHGKVGPLSVSSGANVDFPGVFMKAAVEAGFVENPDYNGASMLGASYVQRTQLKGERMSASRAYLRPALGRPNLDVVVHTHVTRVVIREGRAVGVEMVQSWGTSRATTFNVEAKSEVILSSGTVGSTKLLLLSGVGPASHLESLGIPVVADLPVGQNLQDHLHYHVNFQMTPQIGVSLNDFADLGSILKYITTKSGPLATAYAVEAVFMEALTEEAKALNWPHLIYEVLAMPSSSAEMKALNYDSETIKELSHRDQVINGFQLLATLVHPESRGAIYLKSTDPFEQPMIDTNYLERQEDIDVLIKGIEIAHRIAAAPSLQSIGAALTEEFSYSPCKQFAFNSSDFWRCEILNRPVTIYHATGTNKMGPQDDPTAVLDSELRVRKIHGLRVVDASIMPWVTSCNINAPTIMIAEKAADMIRGMPPLSPTDI